MPSILFVHEYFPAQFGGLARYLSEHGWTVVFATAREEQTLADAFSDAQFKVVKYRGGTFSLKGHPYLALTERAVRNGHSFSRAGASLKKSGFEPDIIFTHSGWGAGIFAKAIWPDAKLVQYLEWWSNYPHLHERPEVKNASPKDDHARTLMNNLPFLLDFQASDLVVSPTQFQANQAPDYIRPRISVQHEGIDCDVFRPLRHDETPLPISGLPDSTPLITFAARSLEPIRGFYDFMAAAEILMKLRPDLHIAIAGEDRARFGPKMKRGQGHKRTMLARHKLDRSRVHFLGRMSQPDYIRLLRRSSVHLYLSNPFIPSRSLFEAMASACPIVATNFAAVLEALGETEPALLVDLGATEQIVASAITLLENPDHAKAMGQEARARALDAFSTQICHPKLERLLDRLASGGNAVAIAAQ